jgi:predicted outer membrane protein
MRHTSILTITVLVAAALALGAQTGAAQEMTDQQFVSMAATGGLVEVELGRLATQRAGRASVQRFGERMITDHGAMNGELAQIAARKGMNVPTTVGDAHRQDIDRLARLSGHDFDRAYMQHMVTDHVKDIAHFERQAQAGTDPELKALAANALPVLRQHLEMAKNINTQVVLGPTEPVQPAASPMGRAAVPGPAWCSGAYAPAGGTNFGTCIGR